MLQHGENVQGVTALKQAIFCSTSRIVEMLLQAGGDIHKNHVSSCFPILFLFFLLIVVVTPLSSSFRKMNALHWNLL